MPRLVTDVSDLLTVIGQIHPRSVVASRPDRACEVQCFSNDEVVIQHRGVIFLSEFSHPHGAAPVDQTFFDIIYFVVERIFSRRKTQSVMGMGAHQVHHDQLAF